MWIIKDLAKGIWLRAWVMLAALLWMTALSMNAQAQPRPDGWRDNDGRPRWCRMYSQRDYWREIRACGEDRQCRWQARRKAERCGLR